MAPAQGTAFTYQGRLLDGGQPAQGTYDFQFRLTDAATNGNGIGPLLTVAPVPVANGIFQTTLDFGAGSFDGGGRWLEIAVQNDGSPGGYTVLGPRQAVTSAPYATYAQNATCATVASALVVTNTAGGTGGVTNGVSASYTAYYPPGTNFVLDGGGGMTNYFVVQPTNTFWLSLVNLGDRKRYVIEFSGMTNTFTGYCSNILWGSDITGWSSPPTSVLRASAP